MESLSSDVRCQQRCIYRVFPIEKSARERQLQPDRFHELFMCPTIGDATTGVVVFTANVLYMTSLGQTLIGDVFVFPSFSQRRFSEVFFVSSGAISRSMGKRSFQSMLGDDTVRAVFTEHSCFPSVFLSLILT